MSPRVSDRRTLLARATNNHLVASSPARNHLLVQERYIALLKEVSLAYFTVSRFNLPLATSLSTRIKLYADPRRHLQIRRATPLVQLRRPLQVGSTSEIRENLRSRSFRTQPTRVASFYRQIFALFIQSKRIQKVAQLLGNAQLRPLQLGSLVRGASHCNCAGQNSISTGVFFLFSPSPSFQHRFPFDLCL